MSRGGKGDWARVPSVIDGHFHQHPTHEKAPAGVPPDELFCFRGQFGDFYFPGISTFLDFLLFPSQSWLGLHHTHFPLLKKKILSRCPFTETRDLSPTSCSAVG